MRKTINLTKVDGCYSKELRLMTPVIQQMTREVSISLEEMKRVVVGIVEPASINAEAKKRFIRNVHKCLSKIELDKLCYEAVIHGMYYHPKRQTA
jgi:hypothetical protein